MSGLPNHIAIIMDGNGRWAKKRFLPRVLGHQFAVKRVKEILRYLKDQGVQAVTLYAFSTENWKRPQEEVSFLMNLMVKALMKELDELHRENVRFRILGERTGLPAVLHEAFAKAETLMAKNTGFFLNLAVNYGARMEILQAVKKICIKAQQGELQPEDLTEAEFEKYLYSYGLPDPDLVIRTGGEARLSNFLLWQNAYAELYFTDILFPDFGVPELKAALSWYSTRERRYGRISEQLDEKPSDTH